MFIEDSIVSSSEFFHSRWQRIMVDPGEFFHLILKKIQEKFFQNGLRGLLCDKYTTIGIIFGEENVFCRNFNSGLII